MPAGKKNRNNKKKRTLPFVSVCTPTFNRRPFIPSMITCFNHQTYPKDKIEWIIIDDGTDKIEDLVKDHPNVKYFKYDEKMTLGKKRNLMHEKSVGDILVYMDDDDYYPPSRISHAVEMLLSHPKALCAGASELYIWFKHIEKMYQFGPYGPNHATAGTFAFKRQLLSQTKYNEDACLAEEKEFLKNYTIPFVQLEPKHTILVFSHIHNTFDKKTLLNNPNPNFVKVSDKTVHDFMKVSDPSLKSFFMDDIENELNKYDPGKPEMKPDVIKQTQELHEKRKTAMQQQQQQQNPQQGQLMMNHPELGQVALNNNQIMDIMNKLQRDLQTKNEEIKKLNQKVNDIAFKQIATIDNVSSTDRFVRVFDRLDKSIFTVDQTKEIARGKYKTTYKGVSMQKDPLSLEVYRAMFEEIGFQTVIEFGAFKGASAAYFNNINDAHVFSFDIDSERVDEKFKNLSNVEFHQFDANELTTLPWSILVSCPKPWIIIEDCHVNCVALLNEVKKYTSPGDYFVIEDTNPQGPNEPWTDESKPYIEYGRIKLNMAYEFGNANDLMIDTKYCDRFGYNCSNQWNSIFRVTETPVQKTPVQETESSVEETAKPPGETTVEETETTVQETTVEETAVETENPIVNSLERLPSISEDNDGTD